MSIGKAFDWAGDQLDNITGKTQADAAKDAAQLQYKASQNAIAEQRRQFEQTQQNLSPYMDFGAGMIPAAQQAYEQSANLYGPGASDAIMNNPMFQALLSNANETIMGNQAALGRVGTGETQSFLQDAALRTGFDVLNQERNAQTQRQQMLLNALNVGQTSAAGLGNLGAQNAANIGNLMTQGANAQASGVVGAANAQSAGTGNLLGLGGMAWSGLGGASGIMDGVSGLLGKLGVPQFAPTQVMTRPGQSYGR